MKDFENIISLFTHLCMYGIMFTLYILGIINLVRIFLNFELSILTFAMFCFIAGHVMSTNIKDISNEVY